MLKFRVFFDSNMHAHVGTGTRKSLMRVWPIPMSYVIVTETEIG